MSVTNRARPWRYAGGKTALGAVLAGERRDLGTSDVGSTSASGGENSEWESDEEDYNPSILRTPRSGRKSEGRLGSKFRPAPKLRLEDGGSNDLEEEEDDGDFFGNFGCCGGRAGQRKGSPQSPDQADFMATLSIGEVINLHPAQTKELLEKTPAEMKAVMSRPTFTRTATQPFTPRSR